MDKEIRNYGSVEIRACEDKETREVDGYAAVFNSQSRDLGFFERIDEHAFDGVIDQSDVYALLNHANSRGVLARSKYGKGTLKLDIDEKGLHYNFRAPKTALGDEVLEYLKRGDISSSSFAFTVKEDKWEKNADGTYLRTIIKFDRLYDVSPVFDPAYEATSCSCRSFEEFKEKEAEEKAEAEKREAEEQAHKEAIKAAYDKLVEEYKQYMTQPTN